MKYEIKNNLVVATAENVEECAVLLKLNAKPTLNPTPKRTYKKRKHASVSYKTDPAMLAIADMELGNTLKITSSSWKSKNNVSNSAWNIGDRLGRKFKTKKVFGGWLVTRTQ